MANENLDWELQKSELIASFREISNALENGATMNDARGALRELCNGLGMFLIEPGIPPELDTEDWAAAFEGVGEKGPGYNVKSLTACLGEEASVSTANVLRRGVKRVLAMSNGENDGNDWIAVVEMIDGRFVYVEAGCDYTGWDCQSGARGMVSNSLANLIRYGMTEESRARLAPELLKAEISTGTGNFGRVA